MLALFGALIKLLELAAKLGFPLGIVILTTVMGFIGLNQYTMSLEVTSYITGMTTTVNNINKTLTSHIRLADARYHDVDKRVAILEVIQTPLKD